MAINMMKEDIVSATEVSKNFGRIRELVKEKSKMIVFKSNKPDLVLVDFEFYENIINTLNALEDNAIANIIEEREQYFTTEGGCSLSDLEDLDRELQSQGI